MDEANRTWFVTSLVAILFLQPVYAQELSTAWRPLMHHEGVDFRYVLHTKADNWNNGVVIMLINTNDYAVEYRFRAVFRSDDGGPEVVGKAVGRLAPGETRTGDSDGLFWIPFTDGRRIGSIGLRGYTITPVSTQKVKKGTERAS